MYSAPHLHLHTPLTHICPCTQNQSLTNSHRSSDMTWNTLTPLLFVNPHRFHYSLYADIQFMFRKHICLLPTLDPCNSLYPFRDFMNIGMQYDLYQELADLTSWLTCMWTMTVASTHILDYGNYEVRCHNWSSTILLTVDSSGVRAHKLRKFKNIPTIV